MTNVSKYGSGKAEFRAHCGGKRAEVELASYDIDKHLNIIVREILKENKDGSINDGRCSSICAHPADARALRDALLAVYPLDVYPVKPKAKITIEINKEDIPYIENVLNGIGGRKVI